MNKFVLRQSFLLLLAAFIWGVAFVAQSVGMEYMGPFTFNAVRSVIGGVTLLPCIALIGMAKKRSAGAEHVKDAKGKAGHPSSDRRQLAAAGIACGVLLCVATNFQQIGIQYTTVGKRAFVRR